MQHVNRWKYILVLIGLIMVAGCTDAARSGQQHRQLPQDLTVSGPKCTVDGTSCASADMTVYSVPKVSLTVENRGDDSILMYLNGGNIPGGRILTSKCAKYRVKAFHAERTGIRSQDVTTQRIVEVGPKQQVAVEWYFELVPNAHGGQAADVNCPLEYELQFEQTLETVKQVQVKASEDVPTATSLDDQTASRSPVELVIDADQINVQETIGGEVSPIQAKSYVVNRGPGEIWSVQHPSSNEHIKLTASGVDGRQCSTQPVQIQQPNQTRTAKVCRFDVAQVDHSQVYDITAETLYGYKIDLNDITLAVSTIRAQ